MIALEGCRPAFDREPQNRLSGPHANEYPHLTNLANHVSMAGLLLCSILGLDAGDKYVSRSRR
jgi:hypothetical protein